MLEVEFYFRLARKPKTKKAKGEKKAWDKLTQDKTPE
jgi:hypothetical protein